MMDPVARRVALRFHTARLIGNTPAAVGVWFVENTLKVGQRIRVWTGRGKDQYHEVRVSAVTLWPKPDDAAYPRDNLSWRMKREDDYILLIDREPAYEDETREAVLQVRGVPDGNTMRVFWKSGRGQPERVYKLETL